jgi:penicillin-binding protein 1A
MTKTQPNPFWKKLLGIGFLISASAFTFLFLLTILIYKGFLGPLPSYDDLKNIKNHTATEIYDRGDVLIGRYYAENRINADDDEISEIVKNTLVATEDARYFKHKGIDIRAWARVFVKSILFSDSSSGGGSTLSQQLAKNLFPRKEYYLLSLPINKIREMFTAVRLERTYSKDDLLTLYLNTVPFSDNIYGIKTAAERFFNKAPGKLTYDEAAVLIGMLKANTAYNPVRNPERALSRRNIVLGQLYKFHYISEQEKNTLTEKPLELNYRDENTSRSFAGYFKSHLQPEVQKILKTVKKENGSEYDLYRDGLKIHTTISATMQRHAEQAVQEHMKNLQAEFIKEWDDQSPPWRKNTLIEREIKKSERYKHLKSEGASSKEITKIFNTPIEMQIFDWNNQQKKVKMSPLDSIRFYQSILNIGVLVADHSTGAIRAWVGGVDHRFFQYDHVKANRQMGSTFKPILYAQALEEGIYPCEYFTNEKIEFPEYDNWSPQNADHSYGGVYSMEGSLASSINIIAVKLIQQIGPQKVSALAQKLGIDQVPSLPSIALGAADGSLYEMVRAYSAIANDGKLPSYRIIEKITTSTGEVIYKAPSIKKENFPAIISSENSRIITKMLQSAVDRGTAAKLRYEYGLKGELAGKTGTTQNQSDGWFIGMTPEIVVGIWVGASNPEVHFKSMKTGQGSSSALPIFGLFIQKQQKWKSPSGSFFLPSEENLALMNCPPYLETYPSELPETETEENKIDLKKFWSNLLFN